MSKKGKIKKKTATKTGGRGGRATKTGGRGGRATGGRGRGGRGGGRGGARGGARGGRGGGPKETTITKKDDGTWDIQLKQSDEVRLSPSSALAIIQHRKSDRYCGGVALV